MEMVQNWRVLKVKLRLGRVHRENTKITGSEFLGRTTCSPGKGLSIHSLHERNKLRGLEKEQEQKDKTDMGRERSKMRNNERGSSKTRICYLILGKYPD